MPFNQIGDKGPLYLHHKLINNALQFISSQVINQNRPTSSFHLQVGAVWGFLKVEYIYLVDPDSRAIINS